MPRVKLSEFSAKRMIYEALDMEYKGLEFDLESSDYQRKARAISSKGIYVAKVDQAIKKRGKSGLVVTKLTKEEILPALLKFKKAGFRYGLVEPYIEHEQSAEKYISLSLVPGGVKVVYSDSGGVDIEDHTESTKTYLLPESGMPTGKRIGALNDEFVGKLCELFRAAHMTLMEINPVVKLGEVFLPLDAAVEVDSSSLFFVRGSWLESDIRESAAELTKSEKQVRLLNAKSPASFNLKVLNPNGAFFFLLSGGGASLVVADEFSSNGYLKDIANYGEYSGNPSQEETEDYTNAILTLMLKSKARRKALVIAGGVANFTDVASTFSGIINALDSVSGNLKKQNVSVFVRRGGPNQAKGLKSMEIFLEDIGINHRVYGPEKSLSEFVTEVSRELR
jgi:ATP-citrate lyase beta-subunit